VTHPPVDDRNRGWRDALGVSHRASSGPPRLTRGLYGHLVAATLVQCLVVVAALAVDSMTPWPAGVLLLSTLGLAAHGAHVGRSGDRGNADHEPGVNRGSRSDTEGRR
jgi:hypothetical protein